MKIDTQGYERQVMEGGQQTIPRAMGILLELPIIHVYGGEWQCDEALRFMAETGFVPRKFSQWVITGRTMCRRLNSIVFSAHSAR